MTQPISPHEWHDGVIKTPETKDINGCLRTRLVWHVIDDYGVRLKFTEILELIGGHPGMWLLWEDKYK